MLHLEDNFHHSSLICRKKDHNPKDLKYQELTLKVEFPALKYFLAVQAPPLEFNQFILSYTLKVLHKLRLLLLQKLDKMFSRKIQDH